MTSFNRELYSIAGPLNFDYERYSTEALLPKVSSGIGTLSLLIFQLFCSIKIKLSSYSRLAQQPNRFLARRFAIKEAAAKALGIGIRRGIAWRDFEVQNDTLGKPCLVLHRQAAEIRRHWVSIADERRYAIATVLFEQ